jgi:acyl-coenzyme A thioesterase PaaI-like protein
MRPTKLSANGLRRLLNCWPPFLFAGIRVRALDDAQMYAKVELILHWYNRNAVGTHFGGSLFAMTDPFWMLLTMRALGPGYIVWDRAADIVFEAPGRGKVTAEFRIDPVVLETIRTATADGEKYLHWFETDVRADDGSVVARVRKQVHIRRKRPDGVG